MRLKIAICFFKFQTNLIIVLRNPDKNRLYPPIIKEN